MSLERFNKAVTGEQSKPQLAIIGAIDCQNHVDSTRFIGVTPRPGTPREPHRQQRLAGCKYPIVHAIMGMKYCQNYRRPHLHCF
jgi:hypothetical protein